jgi:hypothetical protein
MPTGPQGQKRPADAIGLAVMIGKIATGEVEETAISKPRGQAGGEARAAALSAEKRIEIASAGAGARWDAKERRDRVMTQMATKETVAAGRESVRMYPNNTLKAQVREFNETFSGYDLLREHYTKK